MGAPLTDTEARLHKKYIPINITVCALCILAIVTLFVTPFLKIDIGSILRDEATVSYVDKMIDDSIGKDVQDKGKVNYAPVVSGLVQNVLSKADGSISLTAAGAMKVAMAPDEQKAQTALDELLFNESALFYKLIDSVVDGVADVLKTDEGKALLEETVITAVATSVIKGSELGDKLTDEDVKKLTDAFRELGNVQNGDVSPVVTNVVDEIENVLGRPLNEQDRTSVEKQIKGMYKDAADELGEGQTVTFEAIVSVALSSSVDLSEYNIGSLMGDMLGGDDESQNVHVNAAARNDEPPEYTPEDTSQEDLSEEQPEEQPEETTPEAEPEPGTTEENDKADWDVVTSYSGILELMGFGDEAKDDIKAKLRASLRGEMDKAIDEYSDYIAYYGYVFYVFLVYIILWAIQFLFAFIHIFTRNKRFRMWYTFAFNWLTGFLWIAIALLPTLVKAFVPDLLTGDTGGMIAAALNGIGSYLWVSGLCYVALIFIAAIWVTIVKKSIERKAARE